MFNKIILVGNLTKEIELKHTQSGTTIANTSLAASRKFTSNGEKKEEVCFIGITFFGRLAETASQYLRKGSKVLIEGRLNFDQWYDQNGEKRSKHSIVVETMQMLDCKKDSSENNQNENQQRSNNQSQGYNQQQGYGNNQQMGTNAPVYHENSQGQAVSRDVHSQRQSENKYNQNNR